MCALAHCRPSDSPPHGHCHAQQLIDAPLCVPLQFERDFRLPLQRICGLDGVYKQRTGGQQDGVALLWRAERLALLHVEPIEYADALTRGVTDPAEDAVLRKHNVGLVGVFLDKRAQRELVVATTHILFNPRRGLVKLRQLQHLLRRVDALRRQPSSMLGDAARTAPWPPLPPPAPAPTPLAAASAASPASRPCVFMGDCNFTPSSQLHAFVHGVRLRAAHNTEGEWDGHEAEVRRRGRGPPPPPPPPPAYSGATHLVDETHPLAGELLSAYGHGRGSEPEGTTFHRKFLGTVDYIFHTTELRVRAVLPTPSRRELVARRSLPDHETPSDHVPIACVLQWAADEHAPELY
jgi:endonuclease/exonuclease/phosphatase family metal-dependent hydrolase